MGSIPLNRRHARLPAAIALGLAMLSAAHAHEPSVTECKEGADYIRNAAISRDQGITEKKFMQVFETDMRMIQAVPRELRWFVQDDEDEAFLRAQLSVVFRQPQPPQKHAQEFAHACMLRSDEWKASGIHSI